MFALTIVISVTRPLEFNVSEGCVGYVGRGDDGRDEKKKVIMKLILFVHNHIIHKTMQSGSILNVVKHRYIQKR